MKILITGIAGFVGSHLAEYSLAQKAEVFGIDSPKAKKDNITHIEDKIKYIECDITDEKRLKQVVREIKPDRIFHLAAQSFVPASWESPVRTLETNIIGQVNLFEAARECNINPFIQIACSSEEYGEVTEENLPITEQTPLNPLSSYGVSKVAQDLLGYQYNKSYGMNIIRTRAFNHAGPRRGEIFVCSDFAKQIAQIEAGKNLPILYVGNIKAIRDFTDVRDVVRAYWLALEKCEPGQVYNICSGKGYAIKQVADMLLSLTDAKIEIKVDSARLRPSDVQVLIGDSSKFRKATGWQPEILFEKTLKDLLNFWREKI